MAVKRGRPTDNPHDAGRVTVRLSASEKKTLADYCERHMIGTAEAVRRAIVALSEQDKQ